MTADYTKLAIFSYISSAGLISIYYRCPLSADRILVFFTFIIIAKLRILSISGIKIAK
jgi:hypothetical protein